MKLESLVIANQDVAVNTVNAMGLLVWAGDASGGFRRPRPSLNFVGVSVSLPPSLSMYASLSFRGALRPTNGWYACRDSGATESMKRCRYRE